MSEPEYIDANALIDWFSPYGQSDEQIPFETIVEYVKDVAHPSNEPLTLEQLRKMDGEPVYVVDGEKKGYAIVHWSGSNTDKHMSFSRTGTAEGMSAEPVFSSNYSKTWLACRCKPEGSNKP